MTSIQDVVNVDQTRTEKLAVNVIQGSGISLTVNAVSATDTQTIVTHVLVPALIAAITQQDILAIVVLKLSMEIHVLALIFPAVLVPVQERLILATHMQKAVL